jgi:thiol-disulfide isomerase/thioredoxin
MAMQGGRWTVRSILIAVVCFAGPAGAQQQPTGPESGRPALEIRQEMMKPSFLVYSMLGDGNPTLGSNPYTAASGKMFRTAQARQAAGVTLIPAIDRLLELNGEITPIEPEPMRQSSVQEATLLNILKVALGDVQARTIYEKAAAGEGPDTAIAQAILAGADYLEAGADAAGQGKAITRLAEAYKTVDADAPLQEVPIIFSKDPPAAEVRDQLAAFLAADTHSRFSKFMADSMVTHAKAAATLNQPMTLEETLLDGSKFSSSDWKGKVILVDFWTTSCVPCVAQMADIRKIYAALHPKGLEVVGFSRDGSPQLVEKFLEQQPAMPWPQIFRLAKLDPAIQVNLEGGFPTTFLIDRKGILRSVHAGVDANLGADISKLLAEAP